MAMRVKRTGEYGIDAPYLLPVAVLLVLANLIAGIVSWTAWPFVGASVVTACTCCGLYASRRGKFIVWAELLEQLGLRGDEQILDLGCGRGALLLMAAQQLRSGRAIGVDLWSKYDQSGNAPKATWRNAVAEEVTDRTVLCTADIRALPLANNHFDVVVSSMAIHNIRSQAGRDRAIEEAVRVLRPGGRLLIADIWHTRRYCTRLVELGLSNVARRGLGWRLWWSGPWLPTELVTATKPPDRDAGAPRTTMLARH
jgi:SAM-dependent methyltransferase